MSEILCMFLHQFSCFFNKITYTLYTKKKEKKNATFFWISLFIPQYLTVIIWVFLMFRCRNELKYHLIHWYYVISQGKLLFYWKWYNYVAQWPTTILLTLTIFIVLLTLIIVTILLMLTVLVVTVFDSSLCYCLW